MLCHLTPRLPRWACSSNCSWASPSSESCPWRGGAIGRDSPGASARKRNLIPGGTETKEPCPRLKLQPHPHGYPPPHPRGLCLWALPDGSEGHTTGKEDLTDKETESAYPAPPHGPKTTRGPGLWHPQGPFLFHLSQRGPPSPATVTATSQPPPHTDSDGALATSVLC